MRSLLLAGVLALGSAGAAQACSCVPATAAEQLGRADVGFIGQVTKVESAGDNEARTTFRIVTPLKGKPGRTVVVRHRTSSPACGVSYKVGARRLVLARKQAGGEVSTSLCSAIGHPEADYLRPRSGKPRPPV